MRLTSCPSPICVCLPENDDLFRQLFSKIIPPLLLIPVYLIVLSEAFACHYVSGHAVSFYVNSLHVAEGEGPVRYGATQGLPDTGYYQCVVDVSGIRGWERKESLAYLTHWMRE